MVLSKFQTYYLRASHSDLLHYTYQIYGSTSAFKNKTNN